MAADNVTSMERVRDKDGGYAGWADLCRSNLAAYVAASQAMITGCRSLNAELLAFAQSRLKSGLETGQRLAACTSPEDALEIQIEYGRSALRAYADESGRIGELLGRLVTDTTAPLRTQVRAAAQARDSVAA